MTQYVFVNEKAFERNKTNAYGKKGSKYLATQIVVSDGKNRKDSVIVFENAIEDLYQKIKDVRDRYLKDRDKVVNEAWQKWIEFKEEQN